MATVLLVYAIGILITLFLLSGIDKEKTLSFTGLIFSSLTWPVWLVYIFYLYMRDCYGEDRL